MAERGLLPGQYLSYCSAYIGAFFARPRQAGCCSQFEGLPGRDDDAEPIGLESNGFLR